MNESEAKVCPKCGSPMAIRLGELVCKDCGYFMALNSPDGPKTTSSKFQRTAAAPPAYGAGRRGIATFDDSYKKAAIRQAEKWTVVFLSLVLMSVGNYLLNPAFKLESMPEYSFKSLFAAGLVLAALLSLVLFIDWRGFKRGVLFFVCFIALANIGQIYNVSQLTTQLILYKLIVDELLLIWVANLLHRETADTR